MSGLLHGVSQGPFENCGEGLFFIGSRTTQVFNRVSIFLDDVGRFTPGQKVWVALRPEKIRLSKQPSEAGRVNQLKGMVWELGYLGNRSTYQIKTASGKIVKTRLRQEIADNFGTPLGKETNKQ